MAQPATLLDALVPGFVPGLVPGFVPGFVPGLVPGFVPGLVPGLVLLPPLFAGGGTAPPLPPLDGGGVTPPLLPCGAGGWVVLSGCGFCGCSSCCGAGSLWLPPLLFCGVEGTYLGMAGVCGSAGLLSLPPPPQAVSAVRIAPERSSFVVFMLFTLRFIG